MRYGGPRNLNAQEKSLNITYHRSVEDLNVVYINICYPLITLFFTIWYIELI